MFIVLKNQITNLMLSQNYDSNISWQLLNNFKTLNTLSIIWSSGRLTCSLCDRLIWRGALLLADLRLKPRRSTLYISKGQMVIHRRQHICVPFCDKMKLFIIKLNTSLQSVKVLNTGDRVFSFENIWIKNRKTVLLQLYYTNNKTNFDAKHQRRRAWF